jgi:mRNA interferase YafQ
MLKVRSRKTFRKDADRVKSRGKDLAKLEKVVDLLITGQSLVLSHGDHILIGNYKGCRECHLEPDWLLIYRKKDNALILERTGTHADLFRS